MRVTSQLLRLFVLHQSVVKVLLTRFLICLLVLEVLHLLVQLLSIYLSHILHHYSYVSWIVRTLNKREHASNLGL